jgi:hypothetical protein
MSLNARKREDIENDLHSAQERLNSSEIIDLETELKINEMKEKIYRTNIEKETIEADKEQDAKRNELMKSLSQKTKTEIKKYLEDNIGTIDENIIDDKTIEVIWSLQDISKKYPEKNEAIKNVMKKYIDKIKNIEEKMKEYGNDAVRLLCDVRWVDYSKINKENFIAKRIWANLIFIIKDNMDCLMIERPDIKNKDEREEIDANTYKKKGTEETNPIGWWFSIPKSKIIWLESTCCVVNGAKFQKIYNDKKGGFTMEDLFSKGISVHETRHNFNDLIFTDDATESDFIKDTSLFPYPEDGIISPEFLAKQEIVAFVADGSSYEETLKKRLEKSDNSTYNYFKKVREKEWEEIYTNSLKAYQKRCIKNIKIMRMVKENEPQNHINLLSITPIKDRETLLTEKQKEKIKKRENDPKEIQRFEHFFKTAPKDDSESVAFTKDEIKSLKKNIGNIMEILKTPENIDFETVIFIKDNPELNKKVQRYISRKNDLAHFSDGNIIELLQKDLAG